VKRLNVKRWAIAGLPVLLVACAASQPPTGVDSVAPLVWRNAAPSTGTAPPTDVLVPHQGTMAGLSQWWAGLGDPYLLTLIDRAQALSPSVSAAKSRMVQARSSQVQAGAAGGPVAEASLGLSRGVNTVGNPVASALIAGAQASWELDLFGGVAANQAAATARVAGSEAAWHDARVSVAAEVANAYFGLKSCERLLAVAKSQAQSMAESARLVQLLVTAGMAPATQAAGLQVARAQSESALAQTQTQCRTARTGLMALTGATVDELLVHTGTDLAKPLVPFVALPPLPALPAQLLTQRPDILAAQNEVSAASNDVGTADAQRYPRLSLNGSFTNYHARSGGTSGDLVTWSIGPLGISVPLLDGGQRVAAKDAAVARYEDAANLYRAKVRQAVMEVEEALNKLQGSADQSARALEAARHVALMQSAMQAKYDKGMASKIELEDGQRQTLSAKATVYTLEKERLAAWVDLYRALGGGWQADPAKAL
jgi:multidrug efflux system outer membrane protein